MAHVPRQVLIERLFRATELVRIGGTYYHWRTPSKLYYVLDITIWEKDDWPMIHYLELGEGQPIKFSRQLYGEDGWLTPAGDDEGREHQRFVLVE